MLISMVKDIGMTMGYKQYQANRLTIVAPLGGGDRGDGNDGMPTMVVEATVGKDGDGGYNRNGGGDDGGWDGSNGGDDGEGQDCWGGGGDDGRWDIAMIDVPIRDARGDKGDVGDKEIWCQ